MALSFPNKDPQVQPLSQNSGLNEEKVSTLKGLELRFGPHVKIAGGFLMEMAVYGLIVFAIILADLRYLRYRGIKLDTRSVYSSTATFVALVAPIYFNLSLKKHTHSYFETWSERLLDDLFAQQQLNHIPITDEKCAPATDDSRLNAPWFPWGKVCIHILKEISIYLVAFGPLLIGTYILKENVNPESDARGLLVIFLIGLVLFSPMYLNVALFRSVDPYFENEVEEIIDEITFEGGDSPSYPCAKIARTFLKETSIYACIILTLIFTSLGVAGCFGKETDTYGLLLSFAFGLAFSSPDYMLLGFERHRDPYFEEWKIGFLHDISKPRQVDHTQKAQESNLPAPAVVPQHITLKTIFVKHVKAATKDSCVIVFFMCCSLGVGYLFEANSTTSLMFIFFGMGVVIFGVMRRNYAQRQMADVWFEKYKRQPRGGSEHP